MTFKNLKGVKDISFDIHRAIRRKVKFGFGEIDVKAREVEKIQKTVLNVATRFRIGAEGKDKIIRIHQMRNFKPMTLLILKGMINLWSTFSLSSMLNTFITITNK